MTTLVAVADLAVMPVSFDFVVFMQKARMEANRVGATRLHAVIVPFERGIDGMFRDKTGLYDAAEMSWRLWNILIPACRLMGASVTLATDWLQAKRIASEEKCKQWPHDWDKQTLKDRRHLVGDLIKWNKEGQQIPFLEASPHARRKVREAYWLLGKPVVTMTLRSTYLRERNSNRGEWLRARQAIEAMDYAVVTLEDTDVALSQGQGYGELNLDLRAACYQEAAINLQSNNGSASLCWFSGTPYRMFGCGVPAEEWDGLFVKQGLPLGASWPWAGPQQRLVYGATLTEQIVEEFRSWASATN